MKIFKNSQKFALTGFCVTKFLLRSVKKIMLLEKFLQERWKLSPEICKIATFQPNRLSHSQEISCLFSKGGIYSHREGLYNFLNCFSTAAIFAGGLICGIYPTSSYDITAHICKTGDVDILVVENLDLLKQAVGGKSSLRDALPSVKTAVLIDSTEDDIEAGKLFIT